MSLIVDLYSWVGKEEGYDGCLAIPGRLMQRGIGKLQRQRSRQQGEGCKEIQQGGSRGEGTQEEEWGLLWLKRDAKQPPNKKLGGGDSDTKTQLDLSQ